MTNNQENKLTEEHLSLIDINNYYYIINPCPMCESHPCKILQSKYISGEISYMIECIVCLYLDEYIVYNLLEIQTEFIKLTITEI